MKNHGVLIAALIAGVAAPASAVDVLVLSSGNRDADNLLVAVLTPRGHRVTIGPTYGDFDGSVPLAPYDVVYLQVNYNWGHYPNMPVTGQSALVTWIASGGGGLVTSEWTIWKAAAEGAFEGLVPTFPSLLSTDYTCCIPIELTREQFDPILSAGLPERFTLAVSPGANTETRLEPRPGATVFFRSSAFPGAGAVLGGVHGAGRVVNLSPTFEWDTILDLNGATLLSNVLNWAAGTQVCYADCDTSSGARVLDIFDFLCFQTKFDQADPYACDCDQGSGPGVCDIFDFLCFQNAFAGGCP